MRCPLSALSLLVSAAVPGAFSSKISDTPSSYSYVANHNAALSPLVQDLCSSTDFFKYYKLNLFTRECPYFSDDGAFCGNRACAVDTLDEEDVPEVWRASVLGKLSGPTGTAASNLPLNTPPPVVSGSGVRRHVEDEDALGDSSGETCVQDPIVSDDRNFCVPEDEDSACVYVSLVENEERYTGYHGTHAHAIWGSIYRENCFESHGGGDESEPPSEYHSSQGGFGLRDGGYGEAGYAKEEFAQVLRDPLKSGHGNQETCVEKRIFYRIISGMHASISTHICASYLNQLSGRWEPNATCFDERLRAHPERVSNIYFNYVLVSRAVAKLKDYLQSYTFCSGDPAHDVYTATQVSQITTLASDIHYDESSLFEDHLLKEDFRNRFRNISMLMDCVGCDKCRLWGKVQTAGYGTALKILFDDTPNIELRRGEIVALFNTYGRLSHSLDSLRMFDFSMPGSESKKSSKVVEVSDESLLDEEVLSPPLQNPNVGHAGPKAPLDRVSDVWGDVKCRLGPIEEYLPTPRSLMAGFKSELGGFGVAIKFILKSYIELPRNLWYYLFVTRGEKKSFWDNVLAPKFGNQNRA